MPRKRKTMTGDDAQSIGSVPGQRYGEGVAQQELQRAMPAPDVSGAPDVGGSPPMMTGAPQVVPASGQDLGAFLGSHNPNLLSGTQRPDEPVTTGMVLGPGAGPNASAMNPNGTPLRRTLQNLSDQTGNPRWRELMARANL